MSGPTDREIRLAELSVMRDQLLRWVGELDGAGLDAPSALPGWQRRHVVAHLGNLGEAFVRQVTCARRGEVVEVYPGGRRTRDTEIEQVAGWPVAALRDRAVSGIAGFGNVVDGLQPDDWELPTGYREAPVRAVVDCWWRETTIHAVDLALGWTPARWSDAFSEHVIAYLSPRLPAGFDAGAGPVGDPPSAVVRIGGTVQERAAWLSGRAAAVTGMFPEGTTAPELGPWP